jgi:hypothetical protein
MLLDTHFWIFSIFWGLIGAGITTALTWNPERQEAAKRLAIISFVATLFSIRTLLYYGMPVFQGSFFGYFEVLSTTLAAASVVAILIGGRHLIPRAIAYIALAVLVLMTVPTITYISTANWGKSNSHRYAELPKIKINDTEAVMPPTDPSHMVLVNRSVAVFQGAKKLQGEISSRYTIDEASYTLQSIAGHRYWVAPLTLINMGDTLNLSNPESPGYVAVDAENPEADPQLKLGYHIKLFNDQIWGLKVQRHVYQHDYSDRVLGHAFFEVDDEWQPYWTFAYLEKPFAGMNGLSLDKIIMVNVAQEEPEVTVVNPKDKPDWLDRVMDDNLIRTYATDWGLYGRGHSQSYWSIFFNWNKEGTLQPADVELNYTSKDENVWVVPMTATTGSHAVQGVLVFETNRNEANYYPGLNNFYIGDSVKSTMFSVKENVMKYEVESVQLYSIYGELTWVGIYVAPQASGKSFAGIGILHAHSQNPADVIFSTNKTSALSRYANQLATHRQSGQLLSKTAKESKLITATIGRIAPLPSADTATYLFAISGDSNTYRITRDTFSRIPLIREGDEVTFSYMDTNEDEEAVGSFLCVKCSGMEIPAVKAKPVEEVPEEAKE